MALSDTLQDTANTLIEKYGSTITVKEPDSVSYVNGDVVSVDGASTDIKGHVDSYKSEEIEGLIQQGDLKILTKYDVVYTKDTTIVFKGTPYKIINTMPVYLQDSIIYYEIQIRV